MFYDKTQIFDIIILTPETQYAHNRPSHRLDYFNVIFGIEK